MIQTILSEKAVLKWLGISPYQLGNLRELGLPCIVFGREIRFYVKQSVIGWVIKHE